MAIFRDDQHVNNDESRKKRVVVSHVLQFSGREGTGRNEKEK